MINELSNPHGGLPLEIHERCHRVFESLVLQSALDIAVVRVHKITHLVCAQSPHRGMNQMQTRLLPLLTESLLLLQGILEWDFLWHGNPNAMSSQLKLKPPAGWKTMLLQQNLYGCVHRVFLSFRSNARISRVCKTIFLRLAGLNGTIFVSAEEKAAYIDTLIVGAFHSMNNHHDICWLYEIICRGLKNCDTSVLAVLPRGGELVGMICDATLSSIAAIDSQLKNGKTIFEVDSLVRAVDNLLVACFDVVVLLRKHTRGSIDNDPSRAACSKLLQPPVCL